MSGYRFDGKIVIVTGGASGIGRATAAGFAAAGAEVIVADLSKDAARVVAEEIVAKGGRARAVGVDVSSESAVDAMVAAAGDGVDILVCAAGIVFFGTADETPLDRWKTMLDVNLTGTFLCAKAAIAAMRRRGGGSIVTISSSTGAHDALPGAVAYVASKGGVAMLTKALAVDHAAEGIRVNSIAPGPTDTPMLRGVMDEGQRKAFGETLPIGRLGRVEEIAAVAMFLASDAASFITGAVLAVDGGQTASV